MNLSRTSLLSTIVFVGFGGQLEAQSGHAALKVEVDAIVTAALKKLNVPGASLLVAIGDEVVFEKGYGNADVENEVGVTPSTVFRIGSITKQFTSAAILKLVDAGRLKLDDEWNKLVPKFAFPGKKITVRQLLNHTSGIKSFTGLGKKYREIESKRIKHKELFALIAKEPFDFEPGEGFKYNNSGYYLLGVLIEKISGKSYERFLSSEIYSAAGVKQTRYGGAQAIVAHRARGYTRSGGAVANAKIISMRPPFAAGALLSTTRDLHRWNRSLHGGKVVSKESYRKMITPVGKGVLGPRGYAFGLVIDKKHGEARISHAGGIAGCNTFLAYYPARELTVVLLYNFDRARPAVLTDRVAAKVLEMTSKKKVK